MSLPPTTKLASRRAFLRGVSSALPLPYLSAEMRLGLALANSDSSVAGLIVRQKDPDNLEAPFAQLQSFITPNELFYVRNHFKRPDINPGTWRLKVGGEVSRLLEVSYDELRRMPSRTVIATLECAGNNRSFLTPKAKGVAWGLGAVGNAEWTGVPLGAVLDQAGLKPNAVEVVLEGADSGQLTADAKPAGSVHFARSLPLEKARKPEVLLAYRMNGVELPPNHGFPVRAIVPGWYGVASIKWLQRIVVTPSPFPGYFQTFDYSTFQSTGGLAQATPITELQVKAQIARPTEKEVIPAGKPYTIRGMAWAGEARVAKVEISSDSGRTWFETTLEGKPVPYAWRLWNYSWQVPRKPGIAKLMARATDSKGQVQPLERDPDRRNYLISHVLPLEVSVQ
jgi:DMSO/TMAO reductase YedYZ molybdopterin-dependent catalytic subunit